MDLDQLLDVTIVVCVVLGLAALTTIGMWVTWLVKSDDKKLRKITKRGGIISAVLTGVALVGLLYCTSSDTRAEANYQSIKEDEEVNDTVERGKAYEEIKQMEDDTFGDLDEDDY